MGFCLFNNAAIGAAKLAAGGERVAIVDWDVHHGNGTQDIFYDDPRVLYVSTHQSPLYPGTGRLRRDRRRRRCRRERSTCRSRPAPRATCIRAAFDTVSMPMVERFAPDWLIISAGFDAHRNDPLAGLEADERRLRRPGDAASRRSCRRGACSSCSRAATTSTRSPTAWAPRSSALVGESFRPEPASTGEIGLPDRRRRPTALGALRVGGSGSDVPPVLRRSCAVGPVRRRRCGVRGALS